jgi:uncharacterized hydrophobic protein (TIGR00271 family)
MASGFWGTRIMERRIGSSVDHSAVLAEVSGDAAISGHYVVMTVISAGIAILGLLLSSPAVVIGAMLISPLMGPLVGVGFGIALFDFEALRKSLLSFGLGVVLAIFFSMLLVLVSPIQGVTSEIAARTRPNLFDLGVAVLAGLGATYAVIRGRHGAIVGVAIAVALMPPLAVVGFGLATLDRQVLLGAAFLFFTNFMAIALAAAALARVYGFGHYLLPHQTWLQAILVLSGLAVLAVPLSFALRQIAWEAFASGQARAAIEQQFGADARVSQVDIDYKVHPVLVTATVFTPDSRPHAEEDVSKIISAKLGQPVHVDVEQVRVTSGGADAAQLAAARMREARQRGGEISEELAIVAGTDPDDVIVDAPKRIARVSAARLPGATMESYRELEGRVAAENPDWQIDLAPPADAALPTFSAESGDDDRSQAIEVVAWASRKLRLPVRVTGQNSADVMKKLNELNVTARSVQTSGPIRFNWDLPAQPGG